MPSFDVVSKTDMEEVKNATDGAMREIGTRFDFKGSKSSLELKPTSKEVEEFSEKTGGGMAGVAITLMGVSVGAKIMDILFDDEEEIEIITDKE